MKILNGYMKVAGNHITDNFYPLCDENCFMINGSHFMINENRFPKNENCHVLI
jgi:hypothetical protein